MSETAQSQKSSKILMIVLTIILLLFGGLAWGLHDAGIKDSAKEYNAKAVSATSEAETKIKESLTEVKNNLIKDTEKLSTLITSTTNAIDNSVTTVNNTTGDSSKAIAELRTTLNNASTNMATYYQTLKAIETNNSALIADNGQALIDLATLIEESTDAILTAIDGSDNGEIKAMLLDYYNQFVDYSNEAEAYVADLVNQVKDAVAQAETYFDGKFSVLATSAQVQALSVNLDNYYQEAKDYVAKAENYVFGLENELGTGLGTLNTQLNNLSTDLANLGTNVNDLGTGLSSVNTGLANGLDALNGNDWTIICKIDTTLSLNCNTAYEGLQQKIDRLEAEFTAYTKTANAYLDAKFKQLCMANPTNTCTGF